MEPKPALNSIELRVLGVLIEKSLTQPGGYPMTLNAMTLGANQKQNREPVVEYTEGEVSGAIRTLGHKGLVVQAETSPGARAVRFEHRALERFSWDKREQAVMAELMLRGRQTAGELRTRASRMASLPDLQAVAAVLDGLKAASPPFVEELPREPGRSANRFRHLISAEGDADIPAASSDAGTTPTGPGPMPSTVESSDLVERLARLEAEVAGLRALVDRVRDQAGNGLPADS